MFEPHVGEEFPLDARILDARRRLLEEIARSYLTTTITLVAIVFLVGASVLGLVTGSFGYLKAVWFAVAAPLGTIVGYYLPGRKDGG